MTCPSPSSPEHGSVHTPDGLIYGREITYSCDDGYFVWPQNSASRTCERDEGTEQGTWSGVEPQCIGKDELIIILNDDILY